MSVFASIGHDPRHVSATSEAERGNWLLTAALLGACGLCYAAFSYAPWGWPSADGYPAIERAIDPTFAIHDFYTNTTTRYGVDTNQALVLGAIQRYLGVHYTIVLAALNLIRCLVFPAIVYWFFWVFTKSRDTALIGAALGALSNFALPKTLGWAWVWGDPSPAMFAAPIIMAAWTFYLLRRPWAGMLLFTGAVFIHPLLVVHGLIFVALVFLLDYSPQERWKALFSPRELAANLIFAGAFFLQYYLLSAGTGELLPAAELVRIMGYDRHPGDFIPSSFPWENVKTFVVAALAVALMLWRIWAILPRRLLVAAPLASYAAMALAGYLFVEVWPLRFAIQIIPYRFVLVGAPIMLLVISFFTAHALLSKRYLTAAGVVGVFSLASPLVNIRPLAPAGLLFIIAANHTWRPIEAVVRWISTGKRLAAVLALAILLVGIAGYWRREALLIPSAENQHPLYAWVVANTDESAVFLVEQYAGDPVFGDAVNPQKIRLVGRRAVVASKDFPFLEADMKQWHKRWVGVLDKGAYDHIETASPEALLAIHKLFPFDYVVRRTPLPPSGAFSEVARFPIWRGVGAVYLYRASPG